MPKRIVSGEQEPDAPKIVLKQDEHVEEIVTDPGEDRTDRHITYARFYEDLDDPEKVTRVVPLKDTSETYRKGELYERVTREYFYNSTKTQRAGVGG